MQKLLEQWALTCMTDEMRSSMAASLSRALLDVRNLICQLPAVFNNKRPALKIDVFSAKSSYSTLG